jgi:citrate lyase subunit gamma (acyl carrier protein)
MKKIIKSAFAGTLESSDVYIQVKPLEEERVEIVLQSSVEELYGEDIKTLVKDTLEKMQISFIYVDIQDKGALDLVIKARLQAAIFRACECEPEWEALS